MSKAAFFDMDGTIAIPFFRFNNQDKIGFPPEDWAKYCSENAPFAYKDCVPFDAVMSYAKKLYDAGWDLFVLTVTLSQGERDSKVVWLNEHDPSQIFQDIYFVDNDDDKFKFIEEYAEESNTSIGDCMIVEDNYYNILTAIDKGMRAMHVSHIVSGCYDASEDKE